VSTEGFITATPEKDDPKATIPHPTVALWGQAAPDDYEPAPAGAGPAELGFGSRYRVVGALGRGGMGAVYRAEDTLLGRVVALKLLLQGATSRRAKERCLLEARAASALDHPNICTVHEIAEASDGRLCLVMACYDGETLKGRLERGPVPERDAVPIALQVARGLAKAHSRGIVHCDIKPANLMLTADGIVKILDFGIARLADDPSAGARRASFGTPGYMSSEQAAGDRVGPPSDIWSLGVVLVEMLTGRSPQPDEDGVTTAFGGRGTTVSLPPDAPAELQRILSCMLATRPTDRYADANQLLQDLEHLASGSAPSVTARRPAGMSRRQAAAAAAVVSVFGVLMWRGPLSRETARAEPAAGPVHLAASLRRLTDFPGLEWYPSLSQDGSAVLWVRSIEGRSHIFRQRIDDGSITDLSAASAADDTQPAFSPDGRQIAFRSERDGGGIFLRDAASGAVRRLTRVGFNPSWAPDGRSILCSTESIINPRSRRTESQVLRVDLASGSMQSPTRGDAVQATWSPHGRRIAYWGVVTATGERVIWTIPAAGGAAVPAVRNGGVDWNPIWSPDGRYLYFVSDRSGIANLWRVPIDEFTGRVLGDPEPITSSSEPVMFPSISGDGAHIAYSTAEPRTTLARADYDRDSGRASSHRDVLTDTASEISEVDVSPDGRQLVYKVGIPREVLLVADADGGRPRRLLDGEQKSRRPRWAPDGSRIAFYSNRGGRYEIWTVRPDGGGLEAETRVAGQWVENPVWSPDSRWLAVAIGNQGVLIDLAQPLAQRQVHPLPPPRQGYSFCADSWSTDGRWLAGAIFHPDGLRDPGIVLHSLRDGGYRRLNDRGGNPRWLHDNREVLYADANKILLMDVQTGRSQPVLALAPEIVVTDFALSPDEKTLYLAQEQDQGDIWLLSTRSR
jgi:eukaryotic-like serine/threonine-protein kinase